MKATDRLEYTLFDVIVPGITTSIALLVFEQTRSILQRVVLVVTSFVSAALVWLSDIVLPLLSAPIVFSRWAPFLVLFLFAATLWIGMKVQLGRTLTYTMILVLGIAAT